MSKLSIRAGMKRMSPTDRARSRLQSMAATFVSAALDDVPGLRHSPQTTDKGDKQVAAEYREKTPYRPLSDRGCNQSPQRMPGLPWTVSVASVVCQVARCYGLGVIRTHQVRSAARVAQSPSHRCRMEIIRPLTMGQELQELLQEFYATRAAPQPHSQPRFLGPRIGPYRYIARSQSRPSL